MNNNRKKLAGTLLASIADIAAGGYLAGLLAQLLRNYGAWRQAGGQLGFGPGPPLPRGDPASILQGLFSFPYGLYATGLLAVCFAVLFVFTLRVGRDGRGSFDSDRNLTYSTEIIIPSLIQSAEIIKKCAFAV